MRLCYLKYFLVVRILRDRGPEEDNGEVSVTDWLDPTPESCTLEEDGLRETG